MGFISTILGFCGFGVGISSGLVIGYYLFIYFQPSDVKDPVIRPLVEQDSQSLLRLLPEIPFWVKNPDYDRAICKTAKNIATPIIDEQISKYKIESFEFESLTLGSLPPTFQGMKVYLTDEKELIMEPSMKWAGNPNVKVAVRAYGLKATVQPHVDFGLRLLGADLMSIPGLYRFVQELIKDQVANMYLWPKSLEVQILDPAKAMKKPVGILHVKVLRAQKLKKKDLLGASDPYVKLKLTETKAPSKKTTVKHKNLNPEWNEEFSVVVKDPETQALEIIVYDWEQVGKHDKMGMNVVPLKELPPDETKTMTLDLLKNMDPNDVQNDKMRGQIVVELTYKPFKEDDLPKDFENPGEVQKAPEGTPPGGGVLVVTVHEAQDVEGKHHTNPYVRIIFRGEERKTKQIKKNRDPRWEEEFTFMLDEPPVKDRLHVEETLGYVDISLADVISNKRINEKFHLIDSKNGRIQMELQWQTS
ncbi:hypothetical protein DH2020_029645 [Rehmannia glutinosa]|uniref:C2 domain-containing protein n=1 Tax=Rehmannia glutinosa TaxID=99300 RepID=A0ABR0VNR7_REHGL